MTLWARKKGVPLPAHPRNWKGTAGEWLGDAAAFFRKKGVPEAEANAEFIMAAVLETGRNDVRLGASHPLSEKQGFHFWELVQERGQRVPLGYVLGSQGFMGLDIAVTRDVLVPRPETEELAAAARDLLQAGRPDPTVLEIGTGTGCVAIALAKALPGATVYATELSPAALALALRNAEAHGVSRRIRFLKEDLFKPAARGAGWADLVVSNPPYIPSAEIDRLEPEVRKEPRLALDGGKDGLDAIRAIAADAPRHIRKGGWLVLEIGSEQGAAVRGLLEGAGGAAVEVRRDLQGLDRIAVARF
ncbi:MAG: peptide chain release factor N(5)-glutamine methyltransferase [Elusimicrobia bacterium]|nr:peptide chain release factor N(5)-glutamine methyltransferase [Elusimicrobiota bacterium]